MARHRNTFENGMVQDRLDAFAPSDTYFAALNAVHETEGAVSVGIVNEQSNKLAVDVGAKVLGTTYIEQIRKSIIFSEKDGSSIHLFDHTDNTLEHVMSDSEFGCDWDFSSCEFMYAEVKEHNACDDIYIYFSAGCKYYVVNITEMLDPVRRKSVMDCEDCSYFELIHPICTPVINVTPIQYAGSTLESGAVAFAVRLTDYDANYSNWFPISSTTVIESENNFPGEPAISAVKVTLSGLDKRYEYVEVAVIKTGAGVTTVEVLSKMAYSGGTYGFTYYGQKGFPIDLVSLTTPTKVYLQGRDLIQHDGRLFFYNIKREKNLNYQKYANEIIPSPISYTTSLKQQVKYRFPSLQRGECYRFGIVWHYADGTHSKAFAILGNTFGDKSTESDSFIPPDITYDTSNRLTYNKPAANDNTESTTLEEAYGNDIANIDTNEEDLKLAAEALDYGNSKSCCVGDEVVLDESAPTVATDAIVSDIDGVSNMLQNSFEALAEAAQDKPLDEWQLNKTTSLKDAALELYREVVENKSFDERNAPTLTMGGVSTRVGDDTKSQTNYVRTDNWVDINLVETTDQPIGTRRSNKFEKVFTDSVFPDFKDCEGNRMFPEGNVFCYKVPKSPHYSVNNFGVVNNRQSANDPYSDVDVRLMGCEFKNIHIPTEDELPKPLCPTTPYSIVYVKRDDDNSTVIASGWTGGTEVGSNNGKKYNFQRHGVNSKDNVFRGVDEGGSRRTSGETISAYTFHSPDTDFAQGRLDATKISCRARLYGAGWKYGLYANGREPQQGWDGNRIDQRGARIANNITGYETTTGEFDLAGISYTKNGEVTQPVGTMDYPLVNVFNESSVYLQLASGEIPGNERDRSFIGNTLDHEGPLVARSCYVSLLRELPNQYGPIENTAYIPLGIRGRWQDGQVVDRVEGICGDVFIGPYSKRRTSFVSEKVGTTWNVLTRGSASLRGRPKSVCDQPDELIYELLGLNVNQTEFPEAGDRTDPRNYCGLYTNGDTPLSHTEAMNESGPLTDYYYPGTVTGMVYSIVESRVCAWHRTTGPEVEDKIFAEKLGEYHLDSAGSEVRPWEHCYLNHVNYVPVVQPSRKQLAKVAFVRNALMLLVPATALASIASVSDIFEAVGTMFASTGIAALFMMASQTLFTPESLRRIFGIEKCRTDSEEASLYYKSERHKDNWNRYNWDFSKVTTETQYLGINSLYNTCDCDDCTKDDIYQRGGETSKEIYYSAKQNLDTEIDAYRNVRIGMYNEMPVHAGNIRKMFLQNNNMYVHTTKGIWMVQMASSNWPSDIGSQLTGVGELMMHPAMLLDTGSGEGFAGTNHPNSSINVPGHGYFFVDDVARKIYQFNGSPIVASDYGMRKFFNTHLGFCDEEGCYDETMAPKYVMGWDHKYNRLLFTKNDPYEGASFTASFTPSNNGGKWISFHSYVPDFYFRDRYNFYSIVDDKIYLHNVKGDYQTYYGDTHPHFIQTTLNDQTSGLKYFDIKNVTLFQNASKDHHNMLDVTFDEAIFWNYKDSTGNETLNLVSDRFEDNNSQLAIAQENSDLLNITRRFDTFVINDIRNKFNLLCDRFVNNKEDVECIPIEVLDHEITCDPATKQYYNQRNFGGRWINVRLTYNNEENTQLNTHFIEWEDDDEVESKV